MLCGAQPLLSWSKHMHTATMHTHFGSCACPKRISLQTYGADTKGRCPGSMRLTDRAPSMWALSRCSWAVLVCRANTTPNSRSTGPAPQAKPARGVFLDGRGPSRSGPRSACTAQPKRCFTEPRAYHNPANACGACLSHNSITSGWHT